MVCTAGRDGVVRVWDPKSGGRIAEMVDGELLGFFLKGKRGRGREAFLSLRDRGMLRGLWRGLGTILVRQGVRDWLLIFGRERRGVQELPLLSFQEISDLS